MPAILVGRPKSSDAMLSALKKHIIRERHRKKQEQEADAEEERQRKERERQQKQDVMTLGETREQISQLEQKLAQLKEEKHQLFLQLKKVLNEDDNRRRQLVKESNDQLMMHGYSAVATLAGHPQLFLQQNLPLAGRTTIYKVGPTHGTQHTLLPPGTLKRSRSPSPPPSGYHQGYGYKPNSVSNYPPQKVDDARRGHDYVRAVLWNKNTPPYSGSQPFYAPQPATTVAYTPPPSQTVYTREEPVKPSHPVYMGQRPGYHHQPAVPPQEAEKYYSVAPIRPASHVPVHGGAIPIQQPPQGAKTGGITSGYPIRAQMVQSAAHTPLTTGYQLAATTPQSVFASQAPAGRLLYSQASGGHQPAPRYTVPGMQRET